jgi:hypothetical protein
MATTTYQIQGYTGSYPLTTPVPTTYGQITSFNTSTGTYNWQQTDFSVYGVNIDSFKYDLLCDNILKTSATEYFTVDTPTLNFDITDSLGNPPNLNVQCGAVTSYKASITWTPSSYVPNILSQNWSVTSGANVISGSTGILVNVKTTVGYIGSYDLTLTLTTSIGTFTKTITINSTCGSAIDHTYIVPPSGLVTGNVSIGGNPC